MPCMAGERPAGRRAENADDKETGFVSPVRVALGYTSTIIRWRWSSKIAPRGARLTAAPSFISPADGVASLSRFYIVQENRMRRGATAALLLAIFFLAPVRVRAQEMVVGVNVVNPMRASVADQNSLLGQLKAAQVRVIRCGISNDDKGIDFAKRAAAQGIRIQLIIGPAYPPTAPKRPYQPNEFPAMWGGPPLSAADLALSKAAFQRLFDGLDANGIALA